MALSLSAEQRSILQIFNGEEIFVIPNYQRPYSWGYDECYTLYSDLITAFQDNHREYFVGNLVMAKYSKPRYERQIVDGQQRLTTLWIMLKVLSMMCETVNPLRKSLSVAAREGDDVIVKIQSKNDKDKNCITQVYEMTEDSFKEAVNLHANGSMLKFEAKENLIYQAALYMYKWFSYYQEKNGQTVLKDFANYMLDLVYLLPIELYDEEIEEAQNKALTIFETINNRGKDLENADIFKSKLYDKAIFAHEEQQFTQQWGDFIDQCETFNIPVDEVFRYYSHVIRGKENITVAEIRLRDFFISQEYSPLRTKGYKQMMEDLFTILDVLRYIRKECSNENSKCGKWFQVINAYNNNFPLTALVVYLFVNGIENENSIIEFTKSVIRYAYSYGPSRSVKFEIYSIIASVAHKRPIDRYLRDDMDAYPYMDVNRIREGFAMIAYYQENKIVPTISVDRWINSKDYAMLTTGWQNKNISDNLSSLGNYVVLDVACSSASYTKRCQLYNQKTNLEPVKQLFCGFTEIPYEVYLKRDNKMRELVSDFFQGK